VPSPNLYSLSGSHVHLSYATTGIDGKPHLTYQDSTRSLSFSGDEIQSVDTWAGTLVSVTIVKTVDTGSTSFSFFLPSVNIDPIVLGAPWPVHTEGITTIHRIGLLNRGQLNAFTVVALHGSAEIVESLAG
jgi:hypothetical protein